MFLSIRNTFEVPKSNRFRDIGVWKFNFQMLISRKRLVLDIQSVLRTDRNMALIRRLAPSDFRFSHSFTYFRYCACAKWKSRKSIFWHMITYANINSLPLKSCQSPETYFCVHIVGSNRTLWFGRPTAYAHYPKNFRAKNLACLFWKV